MEIIKGNTVNPGAKSMLVIGVIKSGKTSLIGSALKHIKGKILVLAGSEGAENRLGGLDRIDFVACYVTQKDLAEAAKEVAAKHKSIADPEKKLQKIQEIAKRYPWKRFTEATLELLCNPNHGYELLGLDDLTYIQTNLIIDHICDTNPGLAGGSNAFALWKEVRNETTRIIDQLKVAAPYFITTVHVKTADDDTVNKQMFSPQLSGSAKDSIGGLFDAVFHAITKNQGQTTKYLLQLLPDGMRKAGTRVPLGQEAKVTREIENDFGNILKITGGAA